MIIVSLALPGRFGTWCDEVVTALVRAAGHAVTVQLWPTYAQMVAIEPIGSALEAVARQLINSPAYIVMAVRQPDERLLAAFSSTQAPFLVALDDPRVAAAEILAETASAPGQITRAVANSCPLLMHFAALPGALTLHADRARADIGATVSAIARHFGFGLDDAQIAAIADHCARSDLAAPADRGRRPAAAAISDDEQRTIDAALSGYAGQFTRGEPLGPIVWRRELFILFDDGNRRATELIDIAGPPRTLVYGPYIRLPPGVWRARVTLGLSAEAAASTFLVDAMAFPRQLGSVVFAPQHAGIHAVEIAFSIDQPSELGMEIRVLLTSPNARGRIGLGEVVLQPLGMRHPDAHEEAADFERVLNL